VESVIGRKLMNGNEQFYIKDHLGSVVMVIDSTGNPAGSYDYLAYGTQDVLHAASPENTEEWTGKHYYEGPNLYYFGRRWYDPDLGLWISPDPMHQHYSPYAYAENPISSVDKDGLGDDDGTCPEDGEGDYSYYYNFQTVGSYYSGSTSSETNFSYPSNSVDAYMASFIQSIQYSTVDLSGQESSIANQSSNQSIMLDVGSRPNVDFSAMSQLGMPANATTNGWIPLTGGTSDQTAVSDQYTSSAEKTKP